MVKTTIKDGKLKIESPYNKAFVFKIKELGGSWKAPCWVVDARQESRARELLLDIYGEDGTDGPQDLVNLRLTGTQWDDSENDNMWSFCGRTVVRRFSRDTDVTFGPGVVVVDAKFPHSGGSRNNPSISCETETPIFELYDVPRALYERMKDTEGVELLPDTSSAEDKVSKLKAERDKLLVRIKEIDAELAKY